MATTVKKIIKKMMQKAGVLTKNQEPDADEANDALDAMNAMLGSWSNDSMLVPVRKWENFNLQANKAEYTIGLGQDFNTERPINIVTATVKIGETTLPLRVINDEQYVDNVPVKSLPGTSQYITYDNGNPIGRLRFYPVPSSANQLFLLTEKLITQFALNDSFDLPPGWERAIIYNGAIEIAGDYEQDPPDAVVKIAATSMILIRKAVNRNRNLDAYPMSGSQNNIFSGYWNR